MRKRYMSLIEKEGGRIIKNQTTELPKRKNYKSPNAPFFAFRGKINNLIEESKLYGEKVLYDAFHVLIDLDTEGKTSKKVKKQQKKKNKKTRK